MEREGERWRERPPRGSYAQQASKRETEQESGEREWLRGMSDVSGESVGGHNGLGLIVGMVG